LQRAAKQKWMKGDWDFSRFLGGNTINAQNYIMSHR
jgi:hypothetical protein